MNPPAFFGHGRAIKMGKPLDAVGGPWTACRKRPPLGRPGLDHAPDGSCALAGSWYRTATRWLSPLLFMEQAANCVVLNRILFPAECAGHGLENTFMPCACTTSGPGFQKDPLAGDKPGEIRDNQSR